MGRLKPACLGDVADGMMQQRVTRDEETMGIREVGCIVQVALDPVEKKTTRPKDGQMMTRQRRGSTFLLGGEDMTQKRPFIRVKEISAGDAAGQAGTWRTGSF